MDILDPSSLVMANSCLFQRKPPFFLSCYYDEFASDLLIISRDPSALKIFREIQKRGIFLIYEKHYLCTTSVVEIGNLIRTPNFVQHCHVLQVEPSEEFADYLFRYKDLPSLSLDLGYHDEFMFEHDDTVLFQATRLSVKVYQEEFFDCINWVIGSFPKLDHLYFENVATEPLEALQEVGLPNLVRFSSKQPQPDFF